MKRNIFFSYCFFLLSIFNRIEPVCFGSTSVYDGMYAIKIACDPNLPPCNLDLVRSYDAISIVNTLGYEHLTITFISRSYGFRGFSITQAKVEADGSNILITGEASEQNTETRILSLSFNPKNGEIHGSLEGTHSLGRYLFWGKPIQWLGGLLQNSGTVPECLSAQDIPGSYRGSIAGYPGTFIIKNFGERFSASYMSDEQVAGTPIIILNFKSGTWDPVKGLLHLGSENSHTDLYGELVFVYRRRTRAGALILDGYELMGAAINNVSIVKTVSIKSRKEENDVCTLNIN